MFRQNLINFFSRHSFSAKLLLFLLVVAFYLLSLLKLYEVMVWVFPVLCGVMGGCLFFIRPFPFTEQELVNRWYRAARWVARILSILIGVLLIGIGATMVWLLITPPPKNTLAFIILLLVLFVLFLGGMLVVGVLAAIGWFVQGNEETRQWVRTLGQGNGRTRARTAGDKPSSGSRRQLAFVAGHARCYNPQRVSETFPCLCQSIICWRGQQLNRLGLCSGRGCVE